MPNTILERLPVSVCMIAGAEAQRIGRSLDSVANWTSEIIVVINEDVADGTDKIALAAGAKVFRESWKGHIAQKNSAAEKGTQPWILGLDADEVISPGLRADMETLFASGTANQNAAWSFPRCSFYCGRWIRHGDWYPDRQIRLWQRGAARWGGVNPHDRLEVQGGIGRLRADLWHYSYENIDHQIAKIAPYATDFVRHRLAQNRGASFLDFLVRPGWRFLRAYFFRLGFLDGWPGYYIAWVSAFSTVTRYAKIREAQLSKEPRQ